MKKKNTAVIVILAVALFFLAGAVTYAVMSGLGYFDETGEEEIQAPEPPQNILVLGLDARKAGGTGRTDTIMAVNIDPESGKIRILSIPRDTRVLLGGGYERINAAYVYGGVDMVKESVETLLGIKFDHYLVIHFQGFIEVVDVLGGVEVDVPVRMYHPRENIDLQPGLQVLNGEDALGFARYRYTENGDLDRAQHQQEILEALRKKVFSLGSMTKIPELVGIASEYIDTDMSRGEMLDLAAMADRFKDNEIESGILPGETVKIDGLWYYEADQEQLEAVTHPFKKDGGE